MEAFGLRERSNELVAMSERNMVQVYALLQHGNNLLMARLNGPRLPSSVRRSSFILRLVSYLEN